jgi:hypothetical protein
MDGRRLAERQQPQAVEQTVAPGLGGSRFPDTIRMTEDVTRALSKTLEPLGVHATTRP